MTLYTGQCPCCKTEWRLGTRMFGKSNGRIVCNPVPPPTITVCCQCQIPVVEVELFFRGDVSDYDLTRTLSDAHPKLL